MVSTKQTTKKPSFVQGQGAAITPDPRSLAQGERDGELEIGPQPGPQFDFLKTSADIAVYGGAAGGGKTWALLLDPIRHVHKGSFSGVVFRRTYPMVRNEGGLWDESFQLYPLLGATPKESEFEWKFPSGATLRFAHMQHENNKLDWQGSQIPFMAFDELTHFTESQFMYVALSRGRSMSGVRPYVRATCNPDASSWVKKFLAPWVDKTSPIKAESAEILYMKRVDGNIVWTRRGEIPDEELNDYVSVTFVRASIFDNPLLLKKNPGYLALLRALPPIDQQRLLDGDWDVLPTAGKVFNRSWTNVITEIPKRPRIQIISSFGTRQEISEAIDYKAPYKAVRFWDFASTEKELEGDDPDYTVGCKMVRYGDAYATINVVRGQIAAGEIEELVFRVAKLDGQMVAVRWEIEGGSAGRILNASLMRKLGDFDAMGISPQGSKLTRFKPFAQMAQGGAFSVLQGEWVEEYLNELHHFPEKGWHDDQVDGTSGAFSYLSVYGEDIRVGPDIYTDIPQPDLLPDFGEAATEESNRAILTARQRFRMMKENDLKDWLE